MQRYSCNDYNTLSVFPFAIRTDNTIFNKPIFCPEKELEIFAEIIINETPKETPKETLKETLKETKNNLSTNEWGPNAWNFLHANTFSYPDNPTEEDKKNALKFFESLPHLLPCKICGKHCEENYKIHPINVSSRDKFTKWLSDFHNTVNEMLGKPKYSYQTLLQKYSKHKGNFCTEAK